MTLYTVLFSGQPGQSAHCQGEGGHPHARGLHHIPGAWHQHHQMELFAASNTNPGCVEMFCDHTDLLSVCLSNKVTYTHLATPMSSCLTDTRDQRLCCGAQGLPDTCQDQSLRIFSPLFSLMRCHQICITIMYVRGKCVTIFLWC